MSDIRLVIWDLDETFWKGTLSEGGIQDYIQSHHEIVIELAKRGIVSSICSKNNFDQVKTILTEKGLWDYFVFSSIDWTPKGPRLKELINDIQLRPETVLFIDDHAGNRAEASSSVPGLQVSDESIIPNLLAHDFLKGKDDAGLSRLKQYQLLQRKKEDSKKYTTDNNDFLRASNIIVTIEINIEAHLDRVIELVNRTNQLNFTKVRFSDDPALAREEVKKILNAFNLQMGLVHVQDNYGDYGFCGFYVKQVGAGIQKLLHFCFSCRVLGMGIEHWLYEKLDRPEIQVVGEVSSNLMERKCVDWINQDANGALSFRNQEQKSVSQFSHQTNSKQWLPEIRMIGGCDLDALSHYFRQNTGVMRMHTNFVRNSVFVSRNASVNVAYSCERIADDRLRNELLLFGREQADLEGEFFLSPPAHTLFVMSTWADMYIPTYRHNVLDFSIAFNAAYFIEMNLLKMTPDQLEESLKNPLLSEREKPIVRALVNHVRVNYTYFSFDLDVLRSSWMRILHHIPANCFLFVLLPNSGRDARADVLLYHAMINDLIKHFPHVKTVDVTPYAEQYGIDKSVDHLSRLASYHLYQDLALMMKEWIGEKDKAMGVFA